MFNFLMSEESELLGFWSNISVSFWFLVKHKLVLVFSINN